MRIGFYLLGSKGYSGLDSFVKTWGSERVAFVVAAQDKGVENDWFRELEEFCCSREICFRDRNSEHPKSFPLPDYTFAIGWRWMLPREQPPLIVFHDSLLPKYRGFAPLVNMLINGEERVGVTALIAGVEYDRGDIVGQVEKRVSYPMTIANAIRLVEPIYAELVGSVAAQIFSTGSLVAAPQDESLATYSIWRDESDYLINWRDDAEKIRRFIDAVGSPYRGAAAYLNKELVRISGATVEPDITVEGRSEAVGKVIFMREQQPVIVCGKGLLRITGIKSDKGEDLLGNIPFRSRFKDNGSF